MSRSAHGAGSTLRSAGRAAAVASKAVARSRRVQFVDLLRLLASVQMVHGHTLDQLMADHLRQGTVYDRWSFMRGTVSIGFMFAAGISFHLTTLPKWPKHKNDPAAIRRRFHRFFMLLLIGYVLHFPGAVFGGDAAAATAAWHEFLAVDVLQCIGTGVVILELLTLALPKPQHVIAGATILMLLAFGLAPLADAVSPDGPARPLLNYLTHQGGSQFPLLPWNGYIFAGLVCGAIVIPRGVESSPQKASMRLLMITTACYLLAWGLDQLPLSWATAETAHASRPAFAVLKLAVTLSIVTVLAFVGQRIRRLPAFLERLAGESLVIYVSHLVILFGFGIGLARWLGHSLDVAGAISVATAMVLVSLTIGYHWPRFRRWRASRKRERPT